MSLFWIALVALAALLFIPLAFEWSKDFRRRNRTGLLPAGDGGSGYSGDSSDYVPSSGAHHNHGGSANLACDTSGADFGNGGDCGGDGGGGGGGD